MGTKHWAVRQSEPSVDEEGRKEWSDHGPGKDGNGKFTMDIAPFMSVCLPERLDLEQSRPTTFPCNHGLQDEGLLVCIPQCREHVEARCQPWAAHCRAHCCQSQEEVIQVPYPYSLTHSPVLATSDSNS